MPIVRTLRKRLVPDESPLLEGPPGRIQVALAKQEVDVPHGTEIRLLVAVIHVRDPLEEDGSYPDLRESRQARPRGFLTPVCVGLVSLVGLLLAGSLPSFPAEPSRPAHHLGRGFRNLDTTYEYSLHARTLRFVRQALRGLPARGLALPLIANDGAELR